MLVIYLKISCSRGLVLDEPHSILSSFLFCKQSTASLENGYKNAYPAGCHKVTIDMFPINVP